MPISGNVNKFCQEPCCSGKFIFRSLTIADKHAAELSPQAGKPIRSYFCNRCLHIHVTGRSENEDYIPWQGRRR